MQIAHSLVPTPQMSGLYETAREIIAALRGAGHDARIVDPQGSAAGLADRSVPGADESWLKTAELIIDHSGLNKAMIDSGLPVVHIRHGRPHSTFRIEQRGGTPVYSLVGCMEALGQYCALATLWKQHVEFWRGMTTLPVYYVPPCVDLDAWTPEGPSGYGFHGKAGEVNVVIAEAWRDDMDPMPAIHAFELWARDVPKARLHLYGVPHQKKPAALHALLARLQRRGQVGEVVGRIQGLDNVYRAADMVLSPQGIYTRSVREAMACGCPVVSPATYEFDVYDLRSYAQRMTFALERLDRAAVRTAAEELFDPAATVLGLEQLIELEVPAGVGASGDQ